MSLVIVRQAVDTLHASIDGVCDPDILECLETAKHLAQEHEAPQPLEVAGHTFAIQSSGVKPYRYQLVSELGTVLLTDSRKLPAAMVKLSALGLAQYSPDELLAWFAGVVADTFGPMGRSRLSRIDIAVDFQGIDLEHIDGLRFVCPAEYRPIFPNTEHPGTYQFGKGDVVVRVYNKTREIAVSGKGWMRRLWEQSPGYDPSRDVWRFEVQLRRKRLRELGVDSPADGLERLPELLRYGLTWCALKVAHGDKHERFELHPAWKQLMEATGTHTTLERQVIRAELSNLDRIVPSVAGYVVSAAAVLQVYDLDSVLGILLDRVWGHFDSPEAFERAARTRRLMRLG